MTVRAHDFALLDFCQYVAPATIVDIACNPELLPASNVIEIHTLWRKPLVAILTGHVLDLVQTPL